MGWLTEDEEGTRMERIINEIVNGLVMLLACMLFVYSGVLCWIAFNDGIKAALLAAQTVIMG